MPKRQPFNREAPLQTIPAASTITGLSQSNLRAGIKSGKYPFVKSGGTYLIHVPALMRVLEVEAMANCGK
jgi:hypothetical protein